MKAPALRNRVRNGTLIMLVVAVALGAIALPEVYGLSGAIRDTLYRNYTSIEAAQQMHAALYALQLAEHDGALSTALPSNRDTFLHWIAGEEHAITEVGEEELAKAIHAGALRLFAELVASGPGLRHDNQFADLHAELDKLIEINRDAMFRADSRASTMGKRLTYEFAAGLGALLIIGAALSWTLAWAISKPLDELADHLRSFSLRGPTLRLGEQKVAELQAVASEFNRMAERLEQFDKLNVDWLIYEKSKTEAIIESLEDGVVLIDTRGIVAHINELAAIILGVGKEDALGSPFDDLNSNHPHYLRVRAALRNAADAYQGGHSIEVSLHVRGREHNYLLKPVPLRQSDDGRSFGTILILQDVTYLRDKDRARTNLVATLSHELKTPLTSIGLAAELLERNKDDLDPKQQELVRVVSEETVRIGQLADGLLDLARSDTGAIAVSNVALDLAQLVHGVVGKFTVQAEHKHVRLGTHVEEPFLEGHGDPIKLSWVVSNLVANALRYTPNGGAVDVFAERSGRDLWLTVADTGPGIAPEIRERIFEHYAQSGANGIGTGSSGLGLAIVKEIVEAHGGRIFVESSNCGSKFAVQLPIAEQA